MTIRSPFMADRGGNQSVSGTTTSASVTVRADAKSVRVVNTGSVVVFVRIGTSTQTATAADVPVRGGSDLILAKGDGEDTVAVITASSTATVYVQPGEGGQ